MRFPLHARSPNSAGDAADRRDFGPRARRGGPARRLPPAGRRFLLRHRHAWRSGRARDQLPGDLRSGIDAARRGRDAADSWPEDDRRSPWFSAPASSARPSSSTRSPGNFRWPATAPRRSAGSRTRKRWPPIAPSSASRIRNSAATRRPIRRTGCVKTAGARRRHAYRARRTAKPPAPGRYFQRFVRGQQHLGAVRRRRRSARIVGFSRQWTSPAPRRPIATAARCGCGASTGRTRR